MRRARRAAQLAAATLLALGLGACGAGAPLAGLNADVGSATQASTDEIPTVIEAAAPAQPTGSAAHDDAPSGSADAAARDEAAGQQELPAEVRATAHAVTLDGKDVKASGADDKSVAARVAACPGYARLTQAVGQLEDQGYHVAFVVHDLGSGRELTYN